MDIKYELTQETITIDNHTLHRIRALRSFANVGRGELGGFIESESNLDHEGECWVGDTGCVFGNAWICEHARVFGHAQVFGAARVSETAWISGNAEILDTAEIYGDASVGTDAKISGNAKIYGDAHISGIVAVSGDACVCVDIVMVTNIKLDRGIWIKRLKTPNHSYIIISTTLQKILLR